MSIYKLSGTGTGGTENGIAQLDVQFDGVLTAVHVAMNASLTSGGEYAQVEVSFLSTNTFGSNDTRGSIFACMLRMSVVTSGGALLSENTGIGGLAIVVNAGERLWAHVDATASRASGFEAHLYVEDGQGVPTANRRR